MLPEGGEPFALTISSGTDTPPQPIPCNIVPRSALIVAVRGSAWMNGCAAAGKFVEEKNTPDSTHIGIITRFISPDTPSMVLEREAISRPTPPNASADTTHTASSCTSDPRTGTPNSSTALPRITTISTTRNTNREKRNDARKCVRGIGVETSRLSRLRRRASTMAKPSRTSQRVVNPSSARAGVPAFQPR